MSDNGFYWICIPVVVAALIILGVIVYDILE